MEELKTKIKCKKCGSEIECTKYNMFKNNQMINGESVELKYYICSDCHKINIVQVDNGKTLNLLDEAKKLYIHFIACRNKKKKISRKEETKYKRLQKELLDTRCNLFDSLQGKTVIINGCEVKI